MRPMEVSQSGRGSVEETKEKKITEREMIKTNPAPSG
jgi:hypothetical protein